MSENEATQSPTASVARSSILMSIGSIASRVLGLLRQVLIVAAIGQALVGEAFTAANTLPNLIYMVIAGGVLNSVLIPQLVKASKNSDGGEEFTNRILTLAGTGIAAVALVCTAASPFLVRLVASQLPDRTLQLAVFFAYLTLPQILFYGLFALLSQVLNARGHFGAVGWAPALANVVAIAGLVSFMALFEGGTDPNAWTPTMILWFAGSATLGIAAQALILLWPLWRIGFRFRPRWGVRGVGLRQTSKVAGWALGALGISQLGYIVASNVMTAASGQQAELGHFIAGITVYSNALLVFTLPHYVIALSLITALFPRMSKAAAEGDNATLRSDYMRGMTVPAALTLPAAVALIVFALPISQLLFGLRPGQAEATALAIAVMAPAIVPFSIDVLNQKMFYAHEDGRSAFFEQCVLTGVATTVNLTALAFAPERTVLIVAIGIVLSNLSADLFGFSRIRKRIGKIDAGRVWGAWGRMVLAAAIAGGASVPLLGVLTGFFPGRWGTIPVLVIGGGAFLLLYLALARLLKVKELDAMMAPLLRRLGR